MQVELSIVTTGATFLLGIALGLLKYTLASKEAEVERRLTALSELAQKNKESLAAEIASLEVQMRAEQLATVRQDGEMKLLNEVHSKLASDVEEIRANMLGRAEFERWATAMDRAVQDIRRNVEKRREEE